METVRVSRRVPPVAAGNDLYHHEQEEKNGNMRDGDNMKARCTGWCEYGNGACLKARSSGHGRWSR
jgi:hypothetical protein